MYGSSISYWSWHRESSIHARGGHSYSQPTLANGDWDGHECRTLPEGPETPALDAQQTPASCTHEDQQLLHRLLPDGRCFFISRGARGTSPRRPWRNVSTHPPVHQHFSEKKKIQIVTDHVYLCLQTTSLWIDDWRCHVTKHIHRHDSVQSEVELENCCKRSHRNCQTSVK